MTFSPEILRRVKNYSDEFIGDVYQTVVRIDKKDGKAFGYRVYKSVRKRYKVYHYVIYTILNWLEYRGLLTSRLESVEEFKERCKDHKGILRRGKVRKYYKINPGLPSERLGKVKELNYRKVSWKELGDEDNILWEYPVQT